MIRIDSRLSMVGAVEAAGELLAAEAVAQEFPHPSSIGDTIATITVVARDGHTYRGYGYSGLAPVGLSVWAKALADLLGRVGLGR